VGINDYDYYDGADAYTDDQVVQDDGTPVAATVVNAQKELNKRGFYHGPIDGIVGPETVKAVRWFQSADKLPVTGQLDGQTLKALEVS
jgi:peptidoglycan hydrolase-like protein with peptidoglycan-binding domain